MPEVIKLKLSLQKSLLLNKLSYSMINLYRLNLALLFMPKVFPFFL